MKYVKEGVSQGSAVSPNLSFLLINDFVNFSHASRCVLYEDGISFFEESDNNMELFILGNEVVFSYDF